MQLAKFCYYDQFIFFPISPFSFYRILDFIVNSLFFIPKVGQKSVRNLEFWVISRFWIVNPDYLPFGMVPKYMAIDTKLIMLFQLDRWCNIIGVIQVELWWCWQSWPVNNVFISQNYLVIFFFPVKHSSLQRITLRFWWCGIFLSLILHFSI